MGRGTASARRVGVPQEDDPISRHDTKDEAVAAGRAEAGRRQAELIVRDEVGTSTERLRPTG